MPGTVPPPRYAGRPNRFLLPAGTPVWRVHHRAVRADRFTRPRAPGRAGGRFDGTVPTDPYRFYYASLDASTALAEVLLRGLPFGADGRRRLPYDRVADRLASRLRTTHPLVLISLVTGPDLAAVAQDDWLVRAEAHHYPRTRLWAHWMRRQAPWAQGLVWSSKRDEGKQVLMLFGDRVPGAVLGDPPVQAVDLGGAAGTRWVDAVLAPYRTFVAPAAVSGAPRA